MCGTSAQKAISLRSHGVGAIGQIEGRADVMPTDVFCLECNKVTVTLNKACSTCGLSRRINSIFQRLNLPLNFLTRTAIKLRKLILAISAVAAATITAVQCSPASNVTPKANVSSCEPKGECINLRLHNSGDAPDKLKNFEFKVRLKNLNDKTENTFALPPFTPEPSEFLRGPMSAIPASGSLNIDFKAQDGEHFYGEHNESKDFQCDYLFTGQTENGVALKGLAKCF